MSTLSMTLKPNLSRSSIERWVYLALGALAALALWGVLLMLLPAVARAQQAPDPAAQGAAQSPAQSPASVERTLVEVKSGDSLWSMSGERLGPNATSQRVARLVERTYALNRERIGADPNLIFPGQRLLLPTVSEPSIDERSVDTASPEAKPTSEAVGTEASRSPQETVSGRTAKAGTVGQEAPAAPVTAPAVLATPTEARGPSLPEAAPAVPVPTVRETAAEGASPSPFAPVLEAARSAFSTVSSLPSTLASTLARYEARHIIGMGLIVVSFAIPLAVALVAIRRRRTTRRGKERWHREYLEERYDDGIVAAYGWDQETFHNTAPLPLRVAREAPNRGRSGRNGMVETLVATRNRRQRKRKGTHGSRRRTASSHRGTRRRGGGNAAGAWNPKIQSLTRRTTHERRTSTRGAQRLGRGLIRPANMQEALHVIKRVR